MSKIEVNTIEPQCGTTLTLGASGDTVTLASGASQSGFGRSGSVNWQTSIKTGDFTAVSGEGYFINTTSGAITMTLPASPSVGDIVAFKDYAGTFDTNNLTVNRNGSNIIGGTLNPVVEVEGQAGTLVYGDATQGWQIVEAATDADLPRPSFVTATGGTVTTVCTNFKVHTFTGPGTFTVTNAGNSSGSNTVSYMVVAGGAGGGGFGGGGAGGFREGRTPTCSYTVSPLNAPAGLPVTATGYPITVGAGGGAAPRGCSGSNSIFSTITSAGGGGGGGYGPSIASGNPGGSGGGGGAPTSAPHPGQPGGTGNTPPVSPPQGKDGGSGRTGAAAGGGAGGATVAGIGGSCTPAPNAGGNGGAGATTSINGTPTVFSGGGGGAGGATVGNGGSGGGGNGGTSPGTPAAVAGTVNTGGGGGGAYTGSGAAGGSGIVIIRYKYQ